MRLVGAVAVAGFVVAWLATAPVQETATPVSAFAQPMPQAGSPRPVHAASSYYRNCDAARAAGAAPIYAGQPGYRSALDRDGDGIACEPYHGR